MLIFRRYFVLPFLLTAFFAGASVAQQNPADPYSVVHGWRVLPDGMVLGQVSGLAVDSHNHVFVFHRAENSWAADKTHPITAPTILCFDGASGKLLSSWGENRFFEPYGLRVDAHDNVWVTDRALQQVFKFSHDGKLLLTIGTDKLLYVVDGGDLKPAGPDRGRLLKLDLSGKILAQWSRFGNYDGQIYWGHDLAVGKDGAVYVGDVYHGMRVQKFIPR